MQSRRNGMIWFFSLLIANPIYATQISDAPNGCVHDDHNFRCVQFLRNYDGDTITFDIPNVHPLIGKKINVRVYGIDAPEMKTRNSCEKEKGQQAKDLVNNLLKKAKQIDLLGIQREKYFRILADVHVDGVSLASTLLAAGLAYPYFGQTKPITNWCRSTREIASENSKLRTEN